MDSLGNGTNKCSYIHRYTGAPLTCKQTSNNTLRIIIIVSKTCHPPTTQLRLLPHVHMSRNTCRDRSLRICSSSCSSIHISPVAVSWPACLVSCRPSSRLPCVILWLKLISVEPDPGPIKMNGKLL